MSENLSVWNKVKRPPEAALKKITGGRLNNMTNIDPQWRYKIMTEVYGPCGEGWRYEIVRLWTEQGADGNVMAFSQINLFTKTGDEWSKPIPGVGGSMLVVKEKAGLHSSDEAFKMATTDALSVAMKPLGVGADIYMGLFDGSKYNDPPEPPPKITPEDVAGLEVLMQEVGADVAKFCEYFKIGDLADLTTDKLKQAKVMLEGKRK